MIQIGVVYASVHPLFPSRHGTSKTVSNAFELELDRRFSIYDNNEEKHIQTRKSKKLIRKHTQKGKSMNPEQGLSRYYWAAQIASSLVVWNAGFDQEC